MIMSQSNYASARISKHTASHVFLGIQEESYLVTSSG